MQVIKEMLLAIIKNNDDLLNRISEETLDYFTEETMKNCNNYSFKEEYEHYYRDNPECPYCNSRKHSMMRFSSEYIKYKCTNCNTIFKEHTDGTIEKL